MDGESGRRHLAEPFLIDFGDCAIELHALHDALDFGAGRRVILAESPREHIAGDDAVGRRELGVLSSSIHDIPVAADRRILAA